MATTRGEPEPEVRATERIEALTRSIIAGHEQGAVRRIALYLVLSVGIILSVSGWAEVGGLMSGVCFVLLIATDAGL